MLETQPRKATHNDFFWKGGGGAGALASSEERKCEGDDDSCNGVLTCGDHLAHVDRNLDVRRSGSDDGAVGAIRGVMVAVIELADILKTGHMQKRTQSLTEDVRWHR